MRLFVGDGRLLDACLRRGWTELVFGSQRAVCEGWRSALNPKLSKRRLELRLGLVPGGARRYPVRIELPQSSGEIGHPSSEGSTCMPLAVEGRAVRTGCFRIAPGPLNCRYSVRTEYPGGFPSSTSTEEVTSP